MWYPNKGQWIVFWIVGIIVSVGSFGAFDGGGFVVSAIILGGLLIWQLSKTKSS